MISLSSADREMLLRLYCSLERVDMYEFHITYMLSPAQVSNFIRKFEQKRLINVRGLQARLTPAGRRWVLKNRKSIFMKPKSREWAAPLQTVAAERWDPLQPYLPKLALVDVDFFTKDRIDDAPDG